MVRFEVLLFRDGGRSPVDKFIEKCSATQQRKILRQLAYLYEFGLTSANPCLRKLSGTNLWELRILGRDNIRLVCVQRTNTIVVLDVFFKKGKKTPKNDLETALYREKRLDI